MKTLIFALCVLCSSAVIATETESDKPHEGEESHGKHALAVIAGVTLEGDEDLGTLGIEYSYRFHKYWSVGGAIERADREKDSTLVIAFVHLWPYKGWFLGPGLGRKDPGDARENTVRATIGYEFELGGGWGIAPQANVDFIEGHENEEVYIISIGKRY